MKISEILRQLADLVDSKEQETSTEITNRPDIQDVQAGEPTDTKSIEDQAQVNTKSMVAPLQQKLELIKKMAGESGACEDCGCDPCECGSEPDELDIIKQNAGIRPVVAVLSDEDEPFEG